MCHISLETYLKKSKGKNTLMGSIQSSSHIHSQAFTQFHCKHSISTNPLQHKANCILVLSISSGEQDTLVWHHGTWFKGPISAASQHFAFHLHKTALAVVLCPISVIRGAQLLDAKLVFHSTLSNTVSYLAWLDSRSSASQLYFEISQTFFVVVFGPWSIHEIFFVDI